MSQWDKDDTCTNCYFCTSVNSWLECRINAPSLIPSRDIPYQWPRVDANDWCSEGLNGTTKIKYKVTGTDKS